MPPRAWPLRIQDMLGAITVIQELIRTTTFEDFVASRAVTGAVLYHIMILGEAAANIPPEVQRRAVAVPWPLIRGMRNRVVHVYFAIDLEVVWDIVTNDMEPLIPHLQALLEGDPAPP